MAWEDQAWAGHADDVRREAHGGQAFRCLQCLGDDGAHRANRQVCALGSFEQVGTGDDMTAAAFACGRIEWNCGEALVDRSGA
jgi:hypothetical protein